MKSIQDIFERQGLEFSKGQRVSGDKHVSLPGKDLQDNWEKVVGSHYATLTFPWRIEKNTLVVLTIGHGLSENLIPLGPQYLKNLFEHFPKKRRKIYSLEFRTAKTEKELKNFSKNEVNLPNSFSPERRKIEKKAQEIFRDLEDQEMRDLMMKAFLKSQLSEI